jgi:uncharacterized protein (TIGR02996 family)
MSDEGFLAAILEDAEDDTPRLIYADWLDEHGQAERAEFIRLQCELARLPAEDPRRPELEDRERDLLRQQRQAWEGPLREALEAAGGDVDTGREGGWRFDCDFHRGFVEGIRVRSAGWSGGIGDAGAIALAASPHLAAVSTLSLWCNQIGAAGAEALAATPHLANLRWLELSGNAIGDAGAIALAASPYLAGLTRLYVRCCQIGDAGAAALRSRWADRVLLQLGGQG